MSHDVAGRERCLASAGLATVSASRSGVFTDTQSRVPRRITTITYDTVFVPGTEGSADTSSSFT
jgi:hypothetical protein